MSSKNNTKGGKDYTTTGSGTNSEWLIRVTTGADATMGMGKGAGTTTLTGEDGSYYYNNPDGSTYFDNGKGSSTYTSPNGHVAKR
ncbi:hypothetical protein R3P38DRAFT_3203426 [Favolaschia claudopus]|uniref:Uncharacterized protein n=1 Tax=Favolaschia claudopus TaxID=2862362 RepID=A0AAW0ATH8_9AGAR